MVVCCQVTDLKWNVEVGVMILRNGVFIDIINLTFDPKVLFVEFIHL